MFRKLVAEVREMRAKSNICPSARPDADVSALLQQMIDEKVYKTDYDNLTMKLLGENVTYLAAIETLRKIAESKIFDIVN